MKKLAGIFLIFISISSLAQVISGTVTDDKGNTLAYASIIIQGTMHGTTANAEGKYILHLSKPGTYTLICQFVGYKKDQWKVTVGTDSVFQDFKLNIIDFSMEEVIVRSGENPANDIIRKTIEKRSFYAKQLDRFKCEVYTKGIFRLRDYPNKLMGKRLDFKDGDTSKQKIIYLSETISSFAVEKPNNQKIEVLSSKVSGNIDGFGLAAPQFYSIYNNNVTIGTSLNPRGFISPIAENARNYYRYRYRGAFFEDGKQINKIEVIPKRKYEPLFSGFINIVEDEWRIHSVKLRLTKQSQMEFLDSLIIEQIYVPATKDVWVIQSQVIYPYAKIFGIDGYGSFVNVYSKFDPNPEFQKKFFNNTVMIYHDSARRKTDEFWDDTRPVKLMNEEILDYKKKDSLEQLSKNPVYLDSIDRKKNKISLIGAIISGENFLKEKRRTEYRVRSLTDIFSYNIVEGLTINAGLSVIKKLDSGIGRRTLRITPNLRYGFSNHHFNAHLSGTYTFGKKYVSSIFVSGGKRVFQFNNASPIGARNNTFATLLSEKNLLKLYEAYYFNTSFTKGIGSGLTWSIGFQYQDRNPLENTTDFSLFDSKKRDFTPNYPKENINVTGNIKRHQALSANFGISWQPGAKYIQLPDQKINIGSKWPSLSLVYTHGISGLFGSDVDYGKWKFTLSDIVRFKLVGVFNYRIGAGGFLSNKKVGIIDYQHFNGNIARFATAYLNSFQLLPIYEFSNTSKFYGLAHIEHHFNGFLTNKIPGIRKLNWYLVGGANAFHVEKTDYQELFVGFENIFKVLRFDYIFTSIDGVKGKSGFRIGLTTRLERTDD